MSTIRKVIPFLLAAASLGGCMSAADVAPGMLQADAESVSVVTAVQLGAEPGCLGMSDRISGNVTMIKLEEDDELALVLQDGDPVCLDTIGVIKEELARLEGSLQELASEGGQDEDRQTAGGGGGIKIDPNPQPAVQSSVKTTTASGTGITLSSSPSVGGSTAGSAPTAPGGDTPSAPHAE
jgi:hypothetical protein